MILSIIGQYNDAHHNDAQYTDIKRKYTQQNGTQHGTTLLKNKKMRHSV